MIVPPICQITEMEHNRVNNSSAKVFMTPASARTSANTPNNSAGAST